VQEEQEIIKYIPDIIRIRDDRTEVPKRIRNNRIQLKCVKD
jgi:hypothetical protein